MTIQDANKGRAEIWLSERQLFLDPNWLQHETMPLYLGGPVSASTISNSLKLMSAPRDNSSFFKRAAQQMRGTVSTANWAILKPIVLVLAASSPIVRVDLYQVTRAQKNAEMDSLK
jgi:hypothetical protein